MTRQAKETLSTVNLYLGLVADTVIKQDGTLDKFIGDCVMAFWGAPTPNPNHALACVRAAIEAQRAVYQLNQQRSAENKKRELENLALISAGRPPEPMLPILLLGSGINTGMATVGLMGSAAEMQNYTVFGREVNLASRLESASGRGRIFIGQATYEHLRRDDPALAATCVELPPRDLKGFRSAVKAYEVPWRPPGAPPLDEEFAPPALAPTPAPSPVSFNAGRVADRLRLRNSEFALISCSSSTALAARLASMRTAIYPGSFDPITNGHLDVLHRATKLFDRVIVAVAKSESKHPLFTLEERVQMVARAVRHLPNVEADSFEGLLVAYVERRSAQAVVRGLRAVSDFEFEFQLALMNRKLNERIETIFMMPKDTYTFLSSRIVKEMAQLGGDVSAFVPAHVRTALVGKFGPQPA